MAEAQPEQSQQKQPDINQTIDQVLRDGKVSKEELQIISGQYQSQKEDISDATKTKSHNLMKESLTSMLKDYTISDSDDLTKLKTMIADLGLNYTIDPSVKPTQRHIKVRLVDSVIRPVGAWHGWFTPENQGSLSITDIFSYRKDQHISNAISSGYYPTHRDTV